MANKMGKYTIKQLKSLVNSGAAIDVTYAKKQRECVRCLNGIAVTLLVFAYFRTVHGKELVNKVYNQIIK